jgi:hypothetical protein
MYSAMDAVAMGAKGEAMTGIFAGIVLVLLIVGLVSYTQARRRNTPDGRGGTGQAGRAE